MRYVSCLCLFVFLLGLTYAPAQTEPSGAGAKTPSSPPSSENAASNSAAQPSDDENGMDLKSHIQQALRSDPTLASDSIQVAVSEDQIEVSGTVASAKERLTAQRMVQSYSGNRKVIDHLAVKGRNPENAASPSHSDGQAADVGPSRTNAVSASQPPDKR